MRRGDVRKKFRETREGDDMKGGITFGSIGGSLVESNLESAKQAAKLHAAKEAMALVKLGVGALPLPEEAKEFVTTPLWHAWTAPGPCCGSRGVWER